MLELITVFNFFLLILIVFIVEFSRKTKIDFFLTFNLSYLMFFSIIPLILMYKPNLLRVDGVANWSHHFNTYRSSLLEVSIYVLLFYLVFLLVYKILDKHLIIPKELRYKAKLLNSDWIYIAAVFFLLIGIISFYVYADTMGGPLSAITNAQLKRSGVFETTGSLTFFKHFMKSVYFSLFIFMTIVPENHILKKLRLSLLFTSLISSIIVLLAYAGRANILILAFTIIFYKNVLNNKLITSKKQAISYVLIMFFVGGITVFYRPFMLYLSGRQVNFVNTDLILSAFAGLVKSLSVPLVSLMVAIENLHINDITHGTGFLQVFLDIIPKSIINEDYIYTVNNMNTEMFGFVLDSRNYNINSGLLAYFYYEFHWLGILFGGVLSAITIKLFNDLMYVLSVNKATGIIMVYALFNTPNRILAGDQVGGMKSYLILFVEFAVILFIILRSQQKENKILERNVFNSTL